MSRFGKLGGLGEGAVLALFQLRALRRRLTHLDGRRWVLRDVIKLQKEEKKAVRLDRPS